MVRWRTVPKDEPANWVSVQPHRLGGILLMSSSTFPRLSIRQICVPTDLYVPAGLALTVCEDTLVQAKTTAQVCEDKDLGFVHIALPASPHSVLS